MAQLLTLCFPFYTELNTDLQPCWKPINHTSKKEPRVGESYQVDDCPLLTDIQDFEYL